MHNIKMPFEISNAVLQRAELSVEHLMVIQIKQITNNKYIMITIKMETIMD